MTRFIGVPESRLTRVDRRRQVLILGLALLMPSIAQRGAAQSTQTLEGALRSVGVIWRDSTFAAVRKALDDECAWMTDPTKPSPYDPGPCMQKQHEGLLRVALLMRQDASTPATAARHVKARIGRLIAARAGWARLSDTEKRTRLASAERLRERIKSTAGSASVRLNAVAADAALDQHIRRAASIGASRGDCVYWCFCGQAEGCLCCGYGSAMESVLFDP